MRRRPLAGGARIGTTTARGLGQDDAQAVALVFGQGGRLVDQLLDGQGEPGLLHVVLALLGGGIPPHGVRHLGGSVGQGRGHGETSIN
jgi:hypothetical protein